MASLLILQTAVDEGLGACFFGIPPERDAAVRAAFGIPDDFDPVGAITLGHPADDARRPGLARATRRRHGLDEVVHRGHWDADTPPVHRSAPAASTTTRGAASRIRDVPSRRPESQCDARRALGDRGLSLRGSRPRHAGRTVRSWGTASVAKLQALVRIPTVSHRDPAARRHRRRSTRSPTSSPTAVPAAARAPRADPGPRATGCCSTGRARAPSDPVVLMAHLDVVPVDESAPWQHPPFGAEIARRRDLGPRHARRQGLRSSAICEAVERLLEDGLRPGAGRLAVLRLRRGGLRRRRARPPSRSSGRRGVDAVVRARRGRRDRRTRRSPG